jgi:hypothetical protein
LRIVPAAVALAAALVAAGCGGGGGSSEQGASAGAAPHFLSAAELQRGLGNGFRRALDQVAVMSQRGDDAVDLGQSLPTGLLDRVRCRPAAPRPTGAGAWRWGCDVRWQSAEGRPRRTRYDVRLRPNGCFRAGAKPRYHDRYDPTIRTFAEDPLNAIVSVRRGC